MFAKLFAESGLSLDRLKSLLEVGASGSISKAAGGDPVRQSQYSRQIKELEDFFRVKLIERVAKGTCLTPNGKELARISRFFLLGLSNFQRGCLAEEQTFRIGASATFIGHFLVPVLSNSHEPKDRTGYTTETAPDAEIERRLHDLTLDLGIIGSSTISRPLQTKVIGKWKLELWVPKAVCLNEANAIAAFREQKLPLIIAKKEFDRLEVSAALEYEPSLTCDSFLEARTAMEGHQMAAFLPNFLAPLKSSKSFFRVRLPKIDSQIFHFHLAWNPRLLRLNPHAGKTRDALSDMLASSIRPTCTA